MAANKVANEMFLSKKIKFCDIKNLIKKTQKEPNINILRCTFLHISFFTINFLRYRLRHYLIFSLDSSKQDNFILMRNNAWSELRFEILSSASC